MASLTQLETPRTRPSTPSTPSLGNVSLASSGMPQPARPARAVARTYPAVPQKDDVGSLLADAYDGMGARLGGKRPAAVAVHAYDREEHSPPSTAPATGAGTPVRGGDDDDDDARSLRSGFGSDDGEEGGIGGEHDGHGAEVLQSFWQPRKNLFRLAAVALVTMTDGLNDSAAGALLPYIERHYGIGYGVVSLIFVATAFGSIVAAVVVDPMKRRLGRARTLCAAELLMALGYVPMLTMAAPFAAVVTGFFVVGLGEAINVAMGNTFCAGLQQSTAALGIMHASYGLGGISGPLIATAVVVASGGTKTTTTTTTTTTTAGTDMAKPPASVFGRYYFLPFGMCLLSAALALWSFDGYERDWGETREQQQQLRLQARRARRRPLAPGAAAGAGPSATQRAATRLHDAFTAPSARLVLLGALFLFVYQGSEVSIAGWVTSFLITDRGGSEPAVGYITAGFWAGITVGRLLLAMPAQRVGPRRFVYGCVAGAAVFELLLWLVPAIVGDAVAVAVVGLLLGPVYPCAAGLFMRQLSRRERVAGVGTMAAFGSAGGAAAPFVTGVLAQAVGTFVLHPIVIALFAVMLVFWYLIPVTKKPTE